MGSRPEGEQFFQFGLDFGADFGQSDRKSAHFHRDLAPSRGRRFARTGFHAS
jgi:hypothetical protein